MSFNRIPAELRAYPQFVVWKVEHRDGKPTKVPYDAKTGNRAAVDNPATWCDFETAVAVAQSGEVAGVGFMLSAEDPFGFIDLDDPWKTDANGAYVHADPQAEFGRQQNIAATFDSYTERSPSGKGAHVIVRTPGVPNGRRRAGVEVYTSARFMAMTGDVITAAPINERGELFGILWAELGGKAATFDAKQHYQPATETDETIFNRAANAANGDKFVRLWNGDASDLVGDTSGSAIDQALVNMLAFYSKDPSQIERMWKACPQGQRDKTQQRADYRRCTIERAFDRDLAPIDFSRFFGDKGNDEEADELPWVDADELDGKPVPERQWLVPGWIPHANVTLEYSDGGGGKSTLAAQLCASTVLGRDWIGLPVVRQGNALHFAAEDDVTDDHIRRAAIANAYGVKLADLKGFVTMPLAGHDARLAVSAGRGDALSLTPLFYRVQAKIAGLRPVLVVFDNLADVFDGNEISRNQARWFVNQLRRLAIEHDCTIFLTAHPSRDGISSKRGDSGSTAWNNSVRSRLYLQDVEGEPDCRTLEVKKANNGRKGEQVSLRWVFGTFHAVGHTADKTAHSRATDKIVDELFLEILADFTSRGQHVTRGRTSPDYAPKAFVVHPKAIAAKVNVGGFEVAMRRLRAEGRIEDSEIGPPSKRRKTIAAVTA